ncbi:TetR/AcrR family transcriptional regulator [Acidocella aminolytica]|uniref:Transcriptional regulator TetR n=1 Tax=Acidocella aminolytica 101 = DSM 11237 TaxID=1120923 RepID=A0A0D6PBF0_9PROT|nr:TetR/AcrR family transcriptional regulator [Acidocella aminolytica]GAN78661.1 transcriptional regulator TetR [Acidocella aminolytica 101 = DSM 11237]GBQ36702.1 transcriptional regulator [Acidocella aminolytica 101 = DSM 11237]SHE44691.1 transcriptional regulator, TetR family [Acidocella aminolytica 101 = DSM 11237]
MSGFQFERRPPRIALLEAGRQILAEEGLAGLSLRAVTRRVGVSATAAYRHFADREHLLAAIATSGVWDLTTALESADRMAVAPLAAQGEAYIRFATTNPALYRLIFGPERLGHYPELENALAAAYGVLATRVAKTVSAGEAADKSLACWCLLHGLADLAIDGRLPADSGATDILAARLTMAVAPER